MTAGLLRVVSADSLVRMQNDPEFCPEPVTGRFSTRSDTPLGDVLPVSRAITRSDRILLCGSIEQPRFSALAAHAISNEIDVWLLEQPEASVALAIIEAAGITLCDWWPRPVDGRDIFSVSESGVACPPDHTGWLVCVESTAPLTWDAAKSPPDGSVGYVDRAGWIHILGAGCNSFSANELILAPFEGMQRLETHPSVIGACLLALSDDEALRFDFPSGFLAVAEIGEEASPLLEVELLEYCRLGLSAVKCPQGIMFVESLPRTRCGAPDVAAVFEMVRQAASSAASWPANTDP